MRHIVITSQSLLTLFEESRRAGAAVAVALLTLAVLPATGWNATSVAAQGGEGGPGCLTCTAACLDGDGHGRDCELNGPAKIGGNGCRVTIIYDDPLGEGNGWYSCWCLYQGGLCDLVQAMAPTDRERLETEAVEAVGCRPDATSRGTLLLGVEWRGTGSAMEV